MKYMLLTYLDENAWLALTPEEQQRRMEAPGPHIKALKEKKKLLAGGPLHPTSTATTVRYRDGKRIVTDGPFAETREQLGGYTIIEADDLDDALAIASGFIGTQSLASIEVRPILEFDGVPAVPEKP
jgi:hypothetical protein